MDIKDRVVIITGAGRGIGRAFARELARRGARICCSARSTEQLAETVRLIESEGGTAFAQPADVTNRAQVEKMVAATLDRYGPIDILINNAGAFHANGAIWELNADTWWSDVTTNLLGPFHCCQAVLPAMMARNEGLIINLCGGGADRPFLGAAGYGCSKTALMRLTDTLAFELQQAGKPGVLVFGYDPGFVRSAMTEGLAEGPASASWMRGVKDWLAAGEDHPAEESALALCHLLTIANPDISGRIFMYNQNFREIGRRSGDIKSRDTFQIRYLTNF